MQFDRKAVAHKKSLSGFSHKKVFIQLESQLEVSDAGQLADPVVGRDRNETRKDDSNAVT